MTNHCGTQFNDNNQCVPDKRAQVSSAFFQYVYPSAYNDNAQFVHLLYQAYLRRDVPDSDAGYQFWLSNLGNNYGTPASDTGHNALIDAFITSEEYGQRFGQPNM